MSLSANISNSVYFRVLILLIVVDILTARPHPNMYRFSPEGANPKRVRYIGEQNKTQFFFDENSQETFNQASNEDVLDPIPKISGDKQCSGNFCEEIPLYPYNFLKNLLEKNTVYKQLFDDEEVPVEAEVTNRLGEEDNFICKSIVRNISPRVGRNRYNIWKYIINQDDYVQTIRIELCQNEGGACDIIGNLPYGYSTTCKQKYVYTRLLSVNENGFPGTDIFPLPSACACSYKRDVDFLARIGSFTNPVKKYRKNPLR